MICVIIPMYNKNSLTKECVRLVKERAGVKIDILVVDDGSMVEYIDDSINVLRIPENTGFTNAMNQGILWCGERYDYIMMLNNDIIPEQDFIKHLYDHLEKDEVTGIASSCMTKMIDDRKGYLFYGLDLLRGLQASAWECKDEVMYCDWIPTCSALIRFKMIKYIGLLDRQFRNHCSDSDYCIRANQYGWNVAVVTKSKVEHAVSTTIFANMISPEEDQKKFIAKIVGVKYQELFNRLPLDAQRNIWARMKFEQYSKTDKSTTA